MVQLTETVTITRWYNHPRERIFRCWTDPGLVASWWGPEHFRVERIEWNARPGGQFRLEMKGPDDTLIPVGGEFAVVNPPHELDFSAGAYPDDQGRYQLVSQVNVRFEEESGGTRLMLTISMLQAASGLDVPLSGTKTGWRESLNKLDRRLEGTKAAISRDGTVIAYDETGSGPALILIAGALGHRRSPDQLQLAGRLSKHFTVINYDRRGRGASSDRPGGYAVEREIEDIGALVEAAGGSAFLLGISSGAILALEAAERLGRKAGKVALYEPPLILDDARPPLPPDYVEQLNAAIAADDRDGALAIFMTKALLVPEEFLANIKGSPMWPSLLPLAHTLPYDGRIAGPYMAGKPLPEGKWAGIEAPVLVVTGEMSEPFFHAAADALVSRLPNGSARRLAGQSHNVAPEALAPVLIDFLRG